MNIINSIYNNIFLEKIFPDGLEPMVLIGNVHFDLNKKISLSIHTKQRPGVEVEKWGLWGKDYNVIVIEVYGIACDTTILRGWNDVNYGNISISQNADGFLLSHSGDLWDIKIQSQVFCFERCSTYIDGDF